MYVYIYIVMYVCISISFISQHAKSAPCILKKLAMEFTISGQRTFCHFRTTARLVHPLGSAATHGGCVPFQPHRAQGNNRNKSNPATATAVYAHDVCHVCLSCVVHA